MKCTQCDQKVTVRNIVREENGSISCKSCIEKACCKVEGREDQAFIDAKNECFAKACIYTYSQLYKHKIIL